jgi:hypothetical protein
MSYFQLFLQTFAIEAVFLGIVLFRKKLSRVLFIVLLANALTHPLVVFGFIAYPEAKLIVTLLLAETFTILVEAYIYWKKLNLSWWLALLLAGVANLLSWELGPRLSWLAMKWQFYI